MAIRLVFDGEELGFRPEGAPSETRKVDAAGLATFATWSSGYETAVKTGSATALLALGRELHGWLHGSGGWLRALNDGTGPRELSFEVGSDPGEAERQFLDVPWELLATDRGYLAADAERPLVLTRRLGQAGAEAVPAHGDLLLMFMAAAPFGADNLDYEREEAGILAATERLPMQLRVEESGCLEFLRDRIALEAPIEALHLSCHGTIKTGMPHLVLEDPRGEGDEVPAPELMIALGDNKPPLVFLSACRTAEQPAAALPLALSLVRSGVANVLGWDGSVYDTDASEFAHVFYGELARMRSVGYAAAVARQALLRALMSDPELKQGRHWHLARVYVGGHGGGPVCAAGKPTRGLRKAVGFEEFLDKAREEVPVAPARSFVGRRRQAQQILGVFRDKESGIGDRAGVVIHGMGRLGKSSLAARVANRLTRHKTVVVFKSYKASTVLDRVLDALPARTKREFRETWAKTAEEDPAALGDALREILEGPCSAHDPASGKQPILLVVDDLEQILVKPKPDEAVTVEDDYVPVVRAIIEAFADVHSASHLLVTSRYRFVLDDDRGQNLTSRLADIPLPPMHEREQAKQLRAEAGASGTDKDLAELLERCSKAGRGNPGLQSRLTRAALTDAKAAAAAVEEVERFHASGETPIGDLGDFFQQLTLDVYRQALTGEETTLLRAALLFTLPVPEEIVMAAGEATGVEGRATKLSRLEGLGLIDRFPPEEGAQGSLVNALARPLFEALSAADQQVIAAAVLVPLADAWRKVDGNLPYGPRALKLVRIAELAGDAPELLAEASAAGGWWLLRAQQDAETALAFAEQGILAVHTAGLSPDIDVLHLAAEAAGRIGEVGKQEAFLEEGLTCETDDPGPQAMLWLCWADRLFSKGQIEEAETWLEKAHAAFTDVGDIRSTAITRGKIADILFERGRYDEAIRIRQEEEIPTYRRLGDVRALAVTQGTIAEVLAYRGHFDEALNILQEEVLTIFRQVGDIRAMAVAYGKIGDVLFRRGQYDGALCIRQQSELSVYRQLGDVCEIANTQSKIADILARQGRLDEALCIQQKEVLPVYQRLGHVRKVAITQSKIAEIFFQRNQYDEALRIQQKEALPIYQSLGNAREVGITQSNIADILVRHGEYDEALRIQQEEAIPIHRRLVDMRSIEAGLSRIAEIRIARGIRSSEDLRAVVDELGESFSLNLQIGVADGIAAVGQTLGSILAQIGETAEARQVLTAARDACVTVGWQDNAAALDQQIGQLGD